jgi:hypothetical protein
MTTDDTGRERRSLCRARHATARYGTSQRPDPSLGSGLRSRAGAEGRPSSCRPGHGRPLASLCPRDGAALAQGGGRRDEPGRLRRTGASTREAARPSGAGAACSACEGPAGDRSQQAPASARWRWRLRASGSANTSPGVCRASKERGATGAVSPARPPSRRKRRGGW